ncbi:unnamed protein product, partial [Ectocarpus sp. 12 AP-2014]
GCPIPILLLFFFFCASFSASICLKKSQICCLILLLFGRRALKYGRDAWPISLFSATCRWICPHLMLIVPPTASCAIFPWLCSHLCLFGPNMLFASFASSISALRLTDPSRTTEFLRGCRRRIFYVG